MRCSALQCVAVCCSALQSVAVHYETTLEKSVVQCVVFKIPISKNFGTKKLYGVATISRLIKIIGLFCKRALQKRPIFSTETYNFMEPTNRSHPIPAQQEQPLAHFKCPHASHHSTAQIFITIEKILFWELLYQRTFQNLYLLNASSPSLTLSAHMHHTTHLRKCIWLLRNSILRICTCSTRAAPLSLRVPTHTTLLIQPNLPDYWETVIWAFLYQTALQRVAVRCSVLQCVAVTIMLTFENRETLFSAFLYQRAFENLYLLNTSSPSLTSSAHTHSTTHP